MRFEDIDLSRLPPPGIIEQLDFEAMLAARMSDLAARFAAGGVTYDVGALETDPAKILQETDCYRELIVRGRINDAVRAVLLASAKGTDLEQIAGEYHVSRQLITAATPTTPAVYQSDDVLRRNAQLAWEGLSTAGPDGAYYFHSLNAHPQVRDVGVFGPNDGLTVAGVFTPFVDPGQVLISVLGTEGDGTPSDQVVAAVTAELNRREVRPLTDQVIVQKASIVDYAVDATIYVLPGADSSLILTQAQTRVAAYVERQRRVGAAIERFGLAAALFVPDANGVPLVDSILITSPAADVVPDPRAAAYCTSQSVASETVGG